MGVRYWRLGESRRLHEIIFAGSHDAAITSGRSFAQTQDLNIFRQADAGVRIFDLRIIAVGDGDGASMHGYHGDPSGSFKPEWLGGTKVGKIKDKKAISMQNEHTGKSHDLKIRKGMTTGTTGLKLSEMLDQAKSFVTSDDGKDEFLILKFDKCENYKVIADYCISILGPTIFKRRGDHPREFSKLTLGDLRGKVVCVFNDSEEVNNELKDYTDRQGIFRFRSLYSKSTGHFWNKKSATAKAYNPMWSGLQYMGKGGTKAYKVFSNNEKKIQENVSKQKKILKLMASGSSPDNANVLGMMYWTSTGSLSSIKKRNDKMWNEAGTRVMQKLWYEGLESAIGTQLELEQLKCLEYGGKMRIKAFFPNIIMIDFADTGKCQTIFDLNAVKDNLLASAYNNYTNSGRVLK